jgi:hypothetical protein
LKVFIGFLIGIAAIGLVIVLVLGYFGFVPGLSKIFGSDKPVYLGTTYTKQDYNIALTKSGVQFINNSDSASLTINQKIYGPAKAVNTDFTPPEILALLNDKGRAPNFPVKDWQLRINSDGTSEISAIIMTDKIVDFTTSHGGNSQAVADIINKFGIVEKDLPVYVKGTAAVTNGQLTFDATSLKIGRLPISADIVNTHKSDIINIYNKRKTEIPGFSCTNFIVVNGKVHFDGTLPSSVKPK